MVGTILVAGGLALFLRFASQIFSGLMDYNSDADLGAAFWTTLGALLVATPAVLTRWAPWTAIVPGFILTGVSVWVMTTNLALGADMVVDATSWAFGSLFAEFCMNGYGVSVGLPLLLAGIAAVLFRAGVRRELRAQRREPVPASPQPPQDPYLRRSLATPTILVYSEYDYHD